MAIYKAGSFNDLDQPVDKPIGAGTLVMGTGIVEFQKDAETPLADGDELHILRIPWGCELLSGTLSAVEEDDEGNVTPVAVSGTVGWAKNGEEEASEDGLGDVSGEADQGGPLGGALLGGRTKQFARETTLTVKLNGAPSFNGNGRVVLNAIWRVV